MNRVLLTGRLTRDPELRALASGRNVATFSMATNEYIGNGKERAEFHTVVTWERLADICAKYLIKGMTVAIEGRIQTRQWDDDRGARHWKTEIVANSVEMLSGRRKKDYAADALAAQANAMGVEPATPGAGGLVVELDDDDDEDEDEAGEADKATALPAADPQVEEASPVLVG